MSTTTSRPSYIISALLLLGISFFTPSRSAAQIVPYNVIPAQAGGPRLVPTVQFPTHFIPATPGAPEPKRATVPNAPPLYHPTGDCDASLGKRILVGAVAGAILGTAAYSAFRVMTADLPGKKARYAIPLIGLPTVTFAVHEAMEPSMLSCGNRG